MLFSVGVIVAVIALSRSAGGRAAASKGGGGPALTIEKTAVGNPVPAGFVGLSIEFRDLEVYLGQNPHALNPAFIQLLKDIAPNQRRVLRIGGDSSDWTWWPVAHVAQPPGVRYDLTPTWMSVAHSLAFTLDARLILGVNLEADSATVASAEAAAMTSRIGRSAIDALEIGNEPELYASFGWYKSLVTGRQVPGRAPGYDETDYFHDYSNFASAIPGDPLAGPSSGSANWLADLGTFLSDEPRVRLATVHAYPLKHCGKTAHVTIGQLLSNEASAGLASGISANVAVADAHHVPLRVDEMNAVTCGGQRGVSNAFASALWVLDTLFELARTGVSGVNIQTVPNTINEVLGATLADGSWRVRVHPEYYGMLMFAQAAPAGSHLLGLSSQPAAGVKVWATQGPDAHVRVVVINKNLSGSEVVRLRIAAATGSATVEQLRAASAGAEQGVSLGGQTFGATTTTGVLSGHSTVTTLAPSDGTYVVRVPAASAVLLTLASS